MERDALEEKVLEIFRNNPNQTFIAEEIRARISKHQSMVSINKALNVMYQMRIVNKQDGITPTFKYNKGCEH